MIVLFFYHGNQQANTGTWLAHFTILRVTFSDVTLTSILSLGKGEEEAAYGLLSKSNQQGTNKTLWGGYSFVS